MRIRLTVTMLAVLLASLPAVLAGETGAKSSNPEDDMPYEIKLNDAKRARSTSAHPETGAPGLHLLLDFKVIRSEPHGSTWKNDKIYIFEDGVERLRLAFAPA